MNVVHLVHNVSVSKCVTACMFEYGALIHKQITVSWLY